MQETILDGPGNEITVYEGDASPESYSCFAADTPDGPWKLVGEGTGTTSFDFMNATVAQARYIKILDDGDGTANVANAGFDLDAIEVAEHISGTYLVVLALELDDANGNGRLDPGESADIHVTLRNNGDIPAQGTTGTLNTEQLFVDIVTSTADFGELGFGESAQGIYSVTVSELTPNGFIAPFELVVEANGSAYSNTFTFELMVGSVGEDWETGNFSSWDWITGGNAPWMITEVNAYQGTYCARSGNIPNSASSELSITLEIVADGSISFFRSVSSESGYDFLEFYIDEALADRWSGEMEWDQVSYPVLTGNRTFTWVYIKDIYVTSGSDRAWIDNIQFPPLANQSMGTLTGTVTDQVTGQPLEGVSISGVAITAIDGTYSVNLQTGTFEICASREGYDTLCLNATVFSNETTTLDFTLMPAIGLQEIPGEDGPIRIFPSPFSENVNLEIDNPSTGTVGVEILSLTGCMVRILSNGIVPEGTFRIVWDGTDEQGQPVRAGLYLCRIRLNEKVLIHKIVRL
jgi:hypothetical protein